MARQADIMTRQADTIENYRALQTLDHTILIKILDIQNNELEKFIYFVAKESIFLSCFRHTFIGLLATILFALSDISVKFFSNK